jgi:hypothetical protein
MEVNPMFKGRARRRATASFAAAALVVLLASMPTREAVTGGAGRTWSRTVTPYNDAGGNFGRTVTTTCPNGQTATSTFKRSVSNGTITNSRSTTGYTTSGTLSFGDFWNLPCKGWPLTRSQEQKHPVGDWAWHCPKSHHTSTSGNKSCRWGAHEKWVPADGRTTVRIFVRTRRSKPALLGST